MMGRMVFVVICLFIACQESVLAKNDNDEIVAVEYYNEIFGHVHQNSSKQSTSLTTIACGHPVKILKGSAIDGEWVIVRVGPYRGHLMKKVLSREKPRCFADAYPKFFDKFEMELSDIYYWGRLYDQYAVGRSRVR